MVRRFTTLTGRAVVVQALLLALVTGWIAAMANRGFGLGDEAFYLWWFARPDLFHATIQPFVPPLRLLFLAVDQSIPAMRLAGLGALLLVGLLLGRAIAHKFAEQSKGITLAAPTAMLSTYAVWIPTPNYNWLANVSAALLLTGLIRWSAAGARVGLASSSAVGIAGALAFFAKPPFAMFAALMAAAAVWLSIRTDGARVGLGRSVVAVTTCIGTMAGLIVATVGFRQFVDSLRLGIEILDFGNGPTRMILKTLAELVQPPLAALAGILVMATMVAARVTGLRQRPGKLLFLASQALAALALFRFIVAGVEPLGPVGGVGMLIAFGAAALLFEQGPDNRSLRVLWAALLMLPFLLSFGSTNPLYNQTSFYLWPWLLLMFYAWRALAAPLPWIETASVAVVTIGLVAWSSWKPYRLGAPLWTQTQPVPIPLSTSVLSIDPSTAAWMNALSTTGRNLGIRRSTPVIDLSWGGPGTALFLGGRPPVFPWLVPIYPTSAATTDRVWQRLSGGERRSAILIGPFHPNQRVSIPARRFETKPATYRLRARVAPQAGSPYEVQVWTPASMQAGN